MEQIFDILIQSSWQLLILALVVWPLSRLSIRSYPSFAYLLWVVILIKALIPINFTLPAQQVAIVEMSPVITGEFIQTISANPTTTISMRTIALWIWGVGVILLTGKLTLSEVRHRNRMKQAVLISPELWFGSLKEEMGVKQHITLFTNNNTSSPLMQGLWNPRIYLPPDFQTWNQDEQRSILAHELAHIKRMDIVIIYLQAIVKTLYFFHPVVWLVNDQIDLEREKICDDEAIKISQTERERYGEQLFRQLSKDNEGKSVPVLAGGFFMSDSSLIKRFRYIKEKRGTMTNKLKSYHILIVLLVVSLAVLIACSTEQDQSLMDPPGLTNETTEDGFKAYDTPPSPVGGYAAVQDNVIYPDLAREAGIGGTTIVQVEVNELGEAVNPEVLRSSGNVSLDAAAMNAATVTSWTPAMKSGAPVRVKIALPIVFRLKIGGEGHSISTANTIGKKDWDDPPRPTNWKAIGQNIVYPEQARKDGITGTLTMQFTIDEEGNLINPIVKNGPDHDALKEAAIIALKSTQWKPAIKDNKPIAAVMEMGIGFGTEEQQKKTKANANGLRPLDRLRDVPVTIKGPNGLEKSKEVYFKILINSDGQFEGISGSAASTDENVIVDHDALNKWMNTRWEALPKDARLEEQWIDIPLKFTFVD